MQTTFNSFPGLNIQDLIPVPKSQRGMIKLFGGNSRMKILHEKRGNKHKQLKYHSSEYSSINLVKFYLQKNGTFKNHKIILFNGQCSRPHKNKRGAILKAAFKKTLEANLKATFRQLSGHLEGHIPNYP